MSGDIAASDKWRLSSGLLFGEDKLKLMTQKMTDFNIPAVSSEGSKLKVGDTKQIEIHGDSLYFGPLMFTFLVDKDYGNYKVLFNWMVQNAHAGFPEEVDITVDLLDGQNRNQGVSMLFEQCRPVDLGDVLLDTSGATPRLVCTATFNYQDREFL